MMKLTTEGTHTGLSVTASSACGPAFWHLGPARLVIFLHDTSQAVRSSPRSIGPCVGALVQCLQSLPLSSAQLHYFVLHALLALVSRALGQVATRLRTAADPAGDSRLGRIPPHVGVYTHHE